MTFQEIPGFKLTRIRVKLIGLSLTTGGTEMGENVDKLYLPLTSQSNVLLENKKSILIFLGFCKL
jgi:hypothetical protein